MNFKKIIKCLFAAATIILVIISAMFGSASTANASEINPSAITAEAECYTAFDNVNDTNSSNSFGHYLHEFFRSIDLSNLVNEFESYAESIKSVFEMLKKFFGNTSCATA